MTREEAIRRIKAWNLDSDDREVLEVIIPELRESDDEKTRKALIEVLHRLPASTFDYGAEGGYLGATKEQMLAYLERQKEPHYTKRNELFDQCVANCDPEVMKEVSDNVDEMLRKEQKSDGWGKATINGEPIPAENQSVDIPLAEWSEDYDEDNLQTRFAFYTYKDEPSVLYLSNVFVEKTCRTSGYGTRILKAAEKVAEVVGATTIRLKVKQESLANAWYRKNGYSFMTFEDGYNWLEKNIECIKPNKQEWSEDDKTILSWCISDIERAKHCASQTKPELCDIEINWLKSLKPRWKPSDEQMEALKNSAYGAYQNGDGPALRELYEQLKNL